MFFCVRILEYWRLQPHQPWCLYDMIIVNGYICFFRPEKCLATKFADRQTLLRSFSLYTSVRFTIIHWCINYKQTTEWVSHNGSELYKLCLASDLLILILHYTHYVWENSKTSFLNSSMPDGQTNGQSTKCKAQFLLCFIFCGFFCTTCRTGNPQQIESLQQMHNKLYKKVHKKSKVYNKFTASSRCCTACCTTFCPTKPQRIEVVESGLNAAS